MGDKITGFNKMQLQFLKYAFDKKRGLLCCPPGKGKSLAIMGLFLLLRSKVEGFNKMLCVCTPKSAKAWHKANIKGLLILEFKSLADLGVMYGNYEFPAQIYIMTETVLREIVLKGTVEQKRGLANLLSLTNLLVMDEAHKLREYSNTTTKAFKKVSSYYNKLVNKNPLMHRFWFMTATPEYKAKENWHSIIDCLIQPNPFGTWWRFLDNYCIQEQQVSYGNQKMRTANGSHSFKSTRTFTKIVGYRNLEHLDNTIKPFIFSWEETDFRFTFHLHYFNLDNAEKAAYATAIRGLGLDKTYCVDLDVAGERKWAYREKTDVFYLPDGREIQVMHLINGTRIKYGGETATVRGVYDKTKDAQHSVRVVKAQQVNSLAREKLDAIVKIIESGEGGCLVYFNFLDSLYGTAKVLQTLFPNRRVVTLTGRSKGFESTVASLGKNDIVLLSSVGSQSIDFYFNRIILAESFALTPGKAEQLLGRLTRHNSEYRDIQAHFILRHKSVESYFYEKLRLRLSTSTTNVYAKNLPVSHAMSAIPPHLIDEAYLKKTLLWAKDY